MLTANIPAALAHTGSRILANGQNPEALFRDLNTAVTAHFNRHGEQIENLEAAVNAIQQHVNGGAGGGSLHILPVEPDYKCVRAGLPDPFAIRFLKVAA